ncbi:MAG: hypothetical protein EZS28_010087 [Streblomastix strix]|uniref:Uncharacterized protein n=1 Tax=Streblomastix strix TaxID=222440 RepID=A0A5J4WH98_9EUKA|nr:MAG: hypothetical protein EZS28_010087 [Streblomastix strix]
MMIYGYSRPCNICSPLAGPVRNDQVQRIRTQSSSLQQLSEKLLSVFAPTKKMQIIPGDSAQPFFLGLAPINKTCVLSPKHLFCHIISLSSVNHFQFGQSGAIKTANETRSFLTFLIVFQQLRDWKVKQRNFLGPIQTESISLESPLVFGDTTIPHALSVRACRKYVYRDLDPKLLESLLKNFSLDCVISASGQP